MTQNLNVKIHTVILPHQRNNQIRNREIEYLVPFTLSDNPLEVKVTKRLKYQNGHIEL